jgi:hypothetical protein
LEGNFLTVWNRHRHEGIAVKKLIEILRENPQATIIAGGLIIGGFLWGGIYTTLVGYRGAYLYRVNRFTGAVVVCVVNGFCKDEEMATQTPATTP